MKTVRIKSAIPIYLAALIWILFGLFAPIYELLFITVSYTHLTLPTILRV